MVTGTHAQDGKSITHIITKMTIRNLIAVKMREFTGLAGLSPIHTKKETFKLQNIEFSYIPPTIQASH